LDNDRNEFQKLVPAKVDAYKDIESKNKYIKSLRDKLLLGLVQIPDTYINGSLDDGIVNNLNISFKRVDSEALLLLLDLDGICVSSGSACASGSSEPSHVLEAINASKEYIYNSIRFSLSEDNTIEDVDYVIDSVTKNVMKIRKLQK